MRTKKSDQKNILVPYENQWVALNAKGDHIRASGATLKAVNKKLDLIGDKDAVLTYVLPFNKTYSPYRM